ncbi:hypothetical protein MASR2M29_15680 [Spirochaetota bacterium]
MKKLGQYLAVFLLLFASLPARVAADNPAAGDSVQIESDWGFSDFGFWNVQAFAGIKGPDFLPEAESWFKLFMGGGRYGDGWLYYPDGEKYIDPGFKFDGAYFDALGIHALLGMDLGFFYDKSLSKNRLLSQLYLRSDRRWHISNSDGPTNIMDSGLTEKDGYWESSIFTRLLLDYIKEDKIFRLKHGVSGELLLEWTPGMDWNRLAGTNDYFRAGAKVHGYFTIINNRFVSLYSANRFVADILFGNEIPPHARRYVGGFLKEVASGYAVKGLAPFSYDANLRLILNNELRLVFPSIPLPLGVKPELFVFVNSSLVDGMDYRLGSFAEGLYTGGAGMLFSWLDSRLKPITEMSVYTSYSFKEKHWKLFNLIIKKRMF